MITVKNEGAGWTYNRSAVKAYFKKIAGFEGWFYTGPSLNFGHIQRPPRKH